MICRKCGSEIPDNAIRCSNCGIKVNMYCPECRTLNSFGNKHCLNCGYELIVNCDVCGSTNIYSAKECRKCHSPLKKEPSVSASQNTENKKKEGIEIVNSYSFGTSALNKEITFNEPIKRNNDDSMPVVGEIEQNPIENRVFNIPNNVNIEEEKQKSEEVENTEEYPYESEPEPESYEAPDEILSDDIDVDLIENIENLTEEDETFNTLEDGLSDNNETQEENIENENEITNDIPVADTEILQAEIQVDTVKKVIRLIQDSLEKHIISVNGPEGSGKSAVLRQTCDYLSKNGFVTLYGSCTPLVQITSFGFFQDAFLRMMKFPPFTNSTESFIEEFTNSDYSKLFGFLNNNELAAFLNIFYPSQKDVFANIIENKETMFLIMEKVLKSFLINNNLLICIDNFELLDGASYDFLLYLIQKGFVNNRLKILVAYQENKSIQSYFDIHQKQEQMFETLLLSKFQNDELLETLKNSVYEGIEEILEQNFLNELIQKSDGNALRLEQEIALLFSSGYISVKGDNIVINEERKPDYKTGSIEELIKLRLNALIPSAKNVLFMAAIMGYRFSTSILSHSVTMPVDKASKMVDYLIQELFINKVDDYTCEFKSLTLWKLIYQESKLDLLYKENSEHLYASLKPLILSSNLQKLISCTEALQSSEAFSIWQNTASLSAKMGDTNLYVIAQKQCLKILEEQEISDSEIVKLQIYEEIGKLLYEKSPKESVTYLANVLDFEIKNSNIRKIIDVSGYFVKSCYLTGNYSGAVEAVDAIGSAFGSSEVNISELDSALIKTRKLKALCNIGNSEQIINLTEEELIPALEKGLNFRQMESQQYKNFVINALLLSKISLAKAFIMQGNNKVINIIPEIRQLVEKYDYNTEYYETQTDILDAAANTVIGEINKSNEILNSISDRYINKNMDSQLLAEWNLVNIINRVLNGKDDDLKVDLFELAAYTNNINEHFIKNIIKLILGYILKEEGNIAKAIEIFNEEITYFAKEKVAIGALLAWALIVRVSIATEDLDSALNTASKALEIANSPKINNYFFTIYFQKFLAEIYMKQNDLVAAKMYLEKSIMLAKEYELKYQLVELYIHYAKYTEELMKAKRIYSSENVKIAAEMYNRAYDISKSMQVQALIDISIRERAAFKTFCQLNNVEV